MTDVTMGDLQESIRDRAAFNSLEDYRSVCNAFLSVIQQMDATRIISPSDSSYVFFQYPGDFQNKITRPLNSDLLIESPAEFSQAFDRFGDFLGDLAEHQQHASDQPGRRQYLTSNELNKVVYTLQQSVGSIGDSFENPNQSRKRVGQLFESLVKLIIREVGLPCESRTITVPVPGYPGYSFRYELDLVFSRDKAILASETRYIHAAEIVGSVKTTSKDRMDKVFLDKYMLTKLLGRDIPVVAIFLHDVQRARRGNSIFGIATTFKTNHFLGYTVALNRLDGVYYVDPRPQMRADERLREHIKDFQHFLVSDLWTVGSGGNTPGGR